MRPDLNLFLVADGAGGQNAGNVASSIATTTVAHFFEQTKGGASELPELDGLGLFTAARRLAASVQEANREILEIAKTSDKHRGMGTTIAAALFDLEHRHLHVAYVGDSRCYRLRDGRLEQLTHDHSLINDVLELRPNISDERIKRLPQNVITRALGMMENLRVSVRSHEICHGDRYLLCSDGLSDHVTDGQIHEALSLDIDCDEQVDLLMSMALGAATRDNVATIVVDCALPHVGTTGKASTRKKLKKTSRPKMARAVLPDEGPRPTEESVPEIVLYDRPERRDSSPLIHVVPAASKSPDMVDAVQGVLSADEQVTKEYESPPGDRVVDPTGGEPAVRPKRAKKRGGKRPTPLRGGDGSPAPEPATPEPATPEPVKAEPAIPEPPPSEDEITGVRPPSSSGSADIDDEPTHVVEEQAPPRPAKRAPAKRPPAKPKAKKKKGALSTPPRAKTKGKPRAIPLTKARPGPPPPARTSNDGTERGGAAARIAKRPGDNKISAPRINKGAPAELGQPRTGDTQQPPGADDGLPLEDSTPPGAPRPGDPPLRVSSTSSLFGRNQNRTPRFGGKLHTPPDSRRPTLTGPLPSPDTVGEDGAPADGDGLPLPPAREPFDTSDFTNDSVPCHACGSIIMRTADLCMYCGAPTGFLIKK